MKKGKLINRVFYSVSGAIALLIGTPSTSPASTPPINIQASAISAPGAVLMASEELLTRERRHWADSIAAVITKIFPETRILTGGSDEQAVLTLLEHSFDSSKNGPHGRSRRIEILLINSDQANAYASPAELGTAIPARVRVSHRLLAELQNEAELAFVLAHELSHIRNNHFSINFPMSMLTPSQMSRIRNVHEQWELDADRDALSRIMNAALDPQAALNLLKRLEKLESPRDDKCLHGHPVMAERLNTLANEISRAPAPPAPFPG